MRPVAETKEFPGQVRTVPDLEDWMSQLDSAGYFAEAEALAFVGPPVPIGREWRLFVVDGNIVSTSQYACAGEKAVASGCPENVQRYGQTILDIYRPAECCVLDVAEVESDAGSSLKCVEFNSINSAGFYLADVGIIVDALSRYACKCVGCPT